MSRGNWGLVLSGFVWLESVAFGAGVRSHKEVICEPVTEEGSASALIGPVQDGSVTLVSEIELEPASPFHYEARGTLYVRLYHADQIQDLRLEVSGTYVDSAEDHSASLHSTSHPSIRAIHLDFRPSFLSSSPPAVSGAAGVLPRANASFIETGSGVHHAMDCSGSPVLRQHVHQLP